MAATSTGLRVLVWHVHGSWTTSFVQGPHTYLVPRLPGGGPWGRGRAGRDWPSNVREVPLGEPLDVDVAVLQRPEEPDLVEGWLGRRPGVELPAVYVEHNTPREHAVTSRHPLSGQCAVPIVHVTPFNDLMWDNGDCPTRVIPHGVMDPGYRYTGMLSRTAVMINEPVRRGRITGTDLLPAFAEDGPVDVFGIGTGALGPPLTGVGDLATGDLHTEVARRRVYLHTARWTSLGLSLIEAMLLGMPVVCLATTEAFRAVPPEAGIVDTDLGRLREGVGAFLNDSGLARVTGKAAREAALANFALGKFLRAWDRLLREIVEKSR